jgi:N-acetylneuraminic acid mutarotase
MMRRRGGEAAYRAVRGLCAFGLAWAAGCSGDGGSGSPDGGSGSRDGGGTESDAAVVDPPIDPPPLAGRWVAMSQEGQPGARRRHTAVWTGSEMIVWGGVHQNEVLADGGRYNPSEDRWSPVSMENSPTARYAHSAVWTGSEMIVWGGQLSFDERDNRGWAYDPAADSWRLLTTVEAPRARSAHTAMWTDSRMLVFGGEAFGTVDDLPRDGGVYDRAADAWSPTTPVGAPVDNPLGVVWSGSEMLVVYDYNLNGPRIFVVTRYSAEDDSWSETTVGPAPLLIAGGRATWDGSGMVVLGGTDLGVDGSRYDPGTDTWTKVTANPYLSPSLNFSLVEAGEVVIVWGGHLFQEVPGNGTRIDVGGMYDPSSDTWLATADAGEIGARGEHTAIWTGSEMIVWGGTDRFFDTRYLAGGGRFVLE